MKTPNHKPQASIKPQARPLSLGASSFPEAWSLEFEALSRCSLIGIVQRLATAPANWTGQSPNRPIPSSTLEDSPQLSSDLFKPSPVGFSFFLQNLGHLRGGPHLRFSVLLDFQIHHLFDQSGQRLRIHQFLSPD